MKALRSFISRNVLSGATVIVLAILPMLMELRDTTLSIRHAGDWLGWLGAGLSSSSLLLMVREPRIVRWFGGLTRMYRWHHGLGICACVVLLAHPLVIAVAGLSTSAVRAWNLLSPTRHFPANALGWLAVLGLVIGLLAPLLMQIRYATWRRLHLSLSLAVLLGMAHAFAYRGLAFPLVLAAGFTAVALSWRVSRIDGGLGSRPYEVRSLSPIASGTIRVVLEPLTTPLSVAPGQFVMVAFFKGPHYRGCGEFHPFTVSEQQEHGGLVLAIKNLGDCTNRIQSLEKGVAARVQGPYGEFLAETSRSPSLWIAGGIGVTPFVARLRAGELNTPTELIYAFRDPATAPYLAELEKHGNRLPLFRLRTLIAQDDPGPVFALLDEVPQLQAREIHLAGPPLFIQALIAELLRRGICRSHLHFEELDLRS